MLSERSESDSKVLLIYDIAPPPKRYLTADEIEDIVSFIQPNPKIPVATALSIVEMNKTSLRKQLAKELINPKIIPELKEEIRKNYFKTLIQPAESVGVIAAQSFGEKNTQSTLNSFHHAGITEKTVVSGVPRFEELINATKSPKGVSCTIYFKYGNNTIQELRKTINHTLVELRLSKLSKDMVVHRNKEEEPWYHAFELLYSSRFREYTDCLRIHLNMRVLYEYRLEPKTIAQKIEDEYSDLVCVWSPNQYGVIDVFTETSSVNLPEKISFITSENKNTIYLEEVVTPNLEKLIICGIPGITNIFYVKKENEWIVETEGSNYPKILSHPAVDIARTRTNDIWEIYHTLGIQAAKVALYEELMDIMSGINSCHAQVLVDWMTHGGTIASVSRYTVKKSQCGMLSKCSFEETLSNLLNAGFYGEKEHAKGISSCIILGKKSKVGSGKVSVHFDEQIMKQHVREKK